MMSKPFDNNLSTIKSLKYLLLGVFILPHYCLAAVPNIEESRLPTAQKSIKASVNLLDPAVQFNQQQWESTNSYLQAKNLVFKQGNQLWYTAKQAIKHKLPFDDRAIYWQRLKISKVIRTHEPGFKITQSERLALLQLLEKSSRGMLDLDFKQNTQKKIILTGFDPFLLDKNIQQSNPSGVAALLLDGKVIHYAGVTAEINSVLIPVRYKDFDEGLIESFLAPFYTLNNVDLITTVSMGRANFDLERFPGKRRSATAPDNLNIITGASHNTPLVSQLAEQPLPGPEFVEFSLPVDAMQKAAGQYQINNNNQIIVLQQNKPTKLKPNSLQELANQIAVEGSGGGYLSNEISYRSIRLRNQLNSTIPTGHIHTPRIKHFDPKVLAAITQQIESMLEYAISELK
jgi:pyrrolidone-carboxylate peptidase